MPAQSDEHTGAGTPEWQAVREACRQQGRKLYWLAGQANMSYTTFYAKMQRYQGYALRPAEQESIAAALGMTVADIWQKDRD